jgi:hypothetical protein
MYFSPSKIEPTVSLRIPSKSSDDPLRASSKGMHIICIYIYVIIYIYICIQYMSVYDYIYIYIYDYMILYDDICVISCYIMSVHVCVCVSYRTVCMKTYSVASTYSKLNKDWDVLSTFNNIHYHSKTFIFVLGGDDRQQYEAVTSVLCCLPYTACGCIDASILFWHRADPKLHKRASFRLIQVVS